MRGIQRGDEEKFHHHAPKVKHARTCAISWLSFSEAVSKPRLPPGEMVRMKPKSMCTWGQRQGLCQGAVPQHDLQSPLPSQPLTSFPLESIRMLPLWRSLLRSQVIKRVKIDAGRCNTPNEGERIEVPLPKCHPPQAAPPVEKKGCHGIPGAALDKSVPGSCVQGKRVTGERRGHAAQEIAEHPQHIKKGAPS